MWWEGREKEKLTVYREENEEECRQYRKNKKKKRIVKRRVERKIIQNDYKEN